jgi:hypothetical protein
VSHNLGSKLIDNKEFRVMLKFALFLVLKFEGCMGTEE